MRTYKHKEKQALIFLDIDGTLITPTQKVNTGTLPNIIRHLEGQGILFGFNSNRSLEDLIPLYRRFNLNGPIIAENGVYFVPTLKKKKHYLISQAPRNVRAMTLHKIKEFIKHERIDAKIFIGDSTRFITSKKLRYIPLVIVVNGYRLHTGSIHIFRYGKRDITLAIKLEKFFRDFFLNRHLKFKTSLTRAFSNITFHPIGAGKRAALQNIKKYYPGYDFFMIGDDLGDLEVVTVVHSLFAVANAQPEVKHQAAYVATKPYTAGVVEILKHLQTTLQKN